MKVSARLLTVMCFVLPFRCSVIVTAPTCGGPPTHAAVHAVCTVPSGQNSRFVVAVNDTSFCSRRTGPSLFGRVSRLLSAPVGEYGYAVSSQRLVALAAASGLA